MHVKLETLRVKTTLGNQIYELNALESIKIVCMVFACKRLGEFFIRLVKSSSESLILPLLIYSSGTSELEVDSVSREPDSIMERLGESMP